MTRQCCGCGKILREIKSDESNNDKSVTSGFCKKCFKIWYGSIFTDVEIDEFYKNEDNT